MLKIAISAKFVISGLTPPPPPSSAAIIGMPARSAAGFSDLLSLFSPKTQIVRIPKDFAKFKFCLNRSLFFDFWTNEQGIKNDAFPSE